MPPKVWFNRARRVSRLPYNYPRLVESRFIDL